MSCYFLVLALFFAGSIVSKAVKHTPLTLRFDDLQEFSAGTRVRLARALRTDGLLALTDIPRYKVAEAEALQSVSECLRSSGSVEGPVDSYLPDGSFRRTIATDTNGRGAPGGFPVWATNACPHLSTATANLRAVVQGALEMLAGACDRLKGISGPLLQPIVSAGQHLEHFHHYKPSPMADGKPEQEVTLELHTDAGLILAMSPGLLVNDRDVLLDADGNVPPVLEAQLADGRMVAVDPPRGSLLIFVGQGLSDWLPGHGLRALPHALRLSRLSQLAASRVWYGRMVLPPRDFGVGRGVTFGEWSDRARAALTHAHADEEHEGQHAGDEEHEGQHAGCLSRTMLGRRLADQAQSCGAGQIYCWMQCMSAAHLPCGESAQCQDAGTGIVCKTHGQGCKPICPAVVSSLQVSGAGEDRVNGRYNAHGQAGYHSASTRNEYRLDGGSSHLYWKSDSSEWILYDREYRNGSALYWCSENVHEPWECTSWNAMRGVKTPVPKVEQLRGLTGRDNEFCNGIPTDMFMEGFVALLDDSRKDGPCLVMFLNSWMVDSWAKFVLACVASVFAGIFVEANQAARSQIGKYLDSNMPKRRYVAGAIKLALYATHRVVGYLVMLMAMTYSIEIFVAVVLGLTAGHGIFNLKRPVTQGETACCCETIVEDLTDQQKSQNLRELAQAKRNSDSGKPVYKLELRVGGMTCNACTATVTKAVQNLPDVESVQVELQSKRCSVQIRHDTAKAAELEVREAIEDVGFTVENERASI